MMFDFTPLDVTTLMKLLDISAVLLMISLSFTACLCCWSFVEVFREFVMDWKEKRNAR